jgi:hypothetical protein
MLAIPVCIVYIQLINPESLIKEFFLLKEFYLCAVFMLPATFATFAFGVNSSFIEKQITTPLSVFKILQGKFRFCSIISTLLFVVFLPSLFLEIKILELAAAFLFSVGFVFCGLFFTSLYSYKPFDIKASSFYNYQGNDAGSMFAPLLVLLVAFGFVALMYWLFNQTVTLITMSIVGIIFIATNRIWLKFIAQRFEETKYLRLERFNGDY